MTKRIYVAAAYVDRNRALACMRWITEQPGLEVAHNWVAAIDKRKAEGRTEDSLSPQQRRDHAYEDLDELRAADVFWLLAPKAGGRGCWFESGVAFASLTSRCRVSRTVVSGPHYADTIFTELFDHKFVEDSEAFAFIKAGLPR